jgi:hypothetical protein
MAFASHLGPWLLGTVKNTTGSTAGTVRNMGATIVAQTAAVTYSDAATTTAFWLPAGACITAIQFFSASGITATSPTLTVFSGSTTIGSVSLTSATAFAGDVTFTAAAASTLANVGTSDVAIKYTVGGTAPSAGTGTLIVAYIMRGSDGAGNPASV